MKKGGKGKWRRKQGIEWNQTSPWYSACSILTMISPRYGKKNSTERNRTILQCLPNIKWKEKGHRGRQMCRPYGEIWRKKNQNLKKLIFHHKKQTKKTYHYFVWCFFHLFTWKNTLKSNKSTDNSWCKQRCWWIFWWGRNSSGVGPN